MKKAIVSMMVVMLLATSGLTTALALSAGQPMPEIGLTTLDGKKVTAQALRGKVVVVDFWATWCGPCKVELPILQKLYQKYGKQGLLVVGVSVDRDAGNLPKFLSKLGVTFPIAHDAGHSVAERFKPAKMPSSFIVGRDGIVKFVHAGFNAEDAAVFEKEIASLL